MIATRRQRCARKKVPRALCSWSLARAAGLHAALVVGIDLFPIAAHCWCEVGTQTLGDEREHCNSFTPVARW